MNTQQILNAEMANNQSVLLVGPPGCGKTARILEIAEKNQRKVKILRASTSERVDISGAIVPDIDNRVSLQLPLSWLKDMEQGRWVLFLDDIGQAPMDVQASLMRLWDEDLKNKDVLIWGATNRPQDKAGVYGICTPLVTRFDSAYQIPIRSSSKEAKDKTMVSSIVDLGTYEDELDNWLQWATAHQADPVIVGFHRSTSGMYLYNFVPNSTPGARYADYRSWGKLIERFNKGMRSPEQVYACIGYEAGVPFIKMTEEAINLPSWEQIKSDPEHIDINFKNNLMYVLSGIIAQHVKDDINLFDKIASRLPNIWLAYSIKEAWSYSSSELINDQKWAKIIQKYRTILE